jgi:hypothetical protein
MKFKSDIEVQAGIKDSFGSDGTLGQVLSSTVSGVSWITPPVGVTGSGTINFLPKWSSSTGLTNSIIFSNDNSVLIGATSSSATSAWMLNINPDDDQAGVKIACLSGNNRHALRMEMIGTGDYIQARDTLTSNDVFFVNYLGDTTANSFIKSGGTSSQYLMADGSISTGPSVSGFVPYTGANQNVNLGIYTLLAAKGVFSSSGSDNTVEIGHSSGSGIALNIIKVGNGEGLYINKTSGSGNAATIIGTLNATTLVKSGGTAAQILAADGTVITAGTGISISGGTISSTVVGGVTSFNTRTGAVTLSSTDVNTALGYTAADDSQVVKLTGNQTIGGEKTFSTSTYLDGNAYLLHQSAWVNYTNYTTLGGLSKGIFISTTSAAAEINMNNLTALRSYELPNANGTLALTSDIHSPVTIGTPANGLSISGQVLSLGLSGASTTGALSSTDWSTFNSKQNQLNGTGFVRMSGTTPSYITGSSDQYVKADGSLSTALNSRVEVNFTATAGQTTFTTTYDVGQIDVFYNGSKLNPSEFTATNGTTVVLAQPATLNAQISIVKYIGSINGVSGTANRVAKFTGITTLGDSQIDDNGTNVSIGYTTNPNTHKLDVNGTGRFSDTVTFNGSNNVVRSGNELRFNRSDNLIFTRLYDAGSFFALDNRNGNGFDFQSAGTSQMRITSGGNVGIGTGVTDPEGKLTVQGISAQPPISGTTANSLLQLKGSLNNELNIGSNTVAGGYGSYIQASDNNLAASYQLNLQPNGGNVIIGGYADAGFRLDVNGTGRFSTVSTGYTLTLQNVKDDAEGLLVRASDNDGGLYLLNLQSSNAATSQTWVDRFNVTKNGNVGIGTVPQTLTHLYTSTARAIPALGSAGGHFMIQTGGVIATIMGVNANGNFYIQPQHINNGGSVVYNTLLNPSGGGVGIGINYSPSEALHVNSGAGNVPALFESTDPIAVVQFKDNNSTGFNAVGGQTNDLIFYSNNDINMRLNQDGNLLVGCSAVPGAGGSIQGAALGRVGYISVLRAAATCGYFGRTNSGELFAFYNNTAQVGNISIGGSSTSYNTSSDYRLKEDIKPVENALERLQDIKPVNFAWKIDGTRVDGFIAHELAEVIPEAVTGEKDAIKDDGTPIYQGIDQSKIVPLLVAAIQELTARLEILENK